MTIYIFFNEKNTGINCEGRTKRLCSCVHVKMVKFERNTLDEEWKREREGGKKIDFEEKRYVFRCYFYSRHFLTLSIGVGIYSFNVFYGETFYSSVHTGVNRINPRNYDFIKIRNVRNKNVKGVSRMKDTCDTVRNREYARQEERRAIVSFYFNPKQRQLKHYFSFLFYFIFRTLRVTFNSLFSLEHRVRYFSQSI